MFSEFCLSNLLICIVIFRDRPTGLYYILLIEFIDLYNLVIGLQAYNYHFRFACTLGINAVRMMWFGC